MAAHPLSDATLREVLEAAQNHPSQAAAAKALGIPRPTYVARLREARARLQSGFDHVSARKGLESKVRAEFADRELELKEKIKELESHLKSVRREALDDEYVKAKIFGLTQANIDVPSWVVKSPSGAADLGTPTLFCSDWHWGEVVDPKQINGVNQYDLGIARKRARMLVERTTDLLHNHLGGRGMPGLVVALGGDMVSGDIHEELSETNEVPMMPAIVDLFGVLTGVLNSLADSFGRLFVPCVTGNHARNTKKPRAKGRNHTNFDWLLYQLLAKNFEADKRVTFLIPDGTDAHWTLHGHRYCLTHGDQFRGGDGMIGALGPIIRGDHKKRSRNMQIDLGYDTLLLGHWHQLVMLSRLIVNGSLKGYDEYAASGNFGFEIPQQALWLTHPDRGITFSMPVHLGEQRKSSGEWLKWAA